MRCHFHFHWGSHPEALQALPFLLYLKNSALVSFLGIVRSALISDMVAYAFARLRAPGKDMLSAVLLATVMLSQVTLVPVYLSLQSLALARHV